jgi:capsular polysaccharide biosynthesis protein
MELREYGTILKRWWWIPVALALAVGALSTLQLRPWVTPPPSYAASMRLLVGVLPAADADTTAYDPRYYGWLTSEYLVDDFTEVVRSGLFAQQVSDRLADESIIVPPGLIQGSAATGKLHRIITISLSGSDADQLLAIANAAAAELSENAAFYFKQLGTDGAGVTLIDGPGVGAVAPSLGSRLDLPLRVLLALVVGLGIVALLAYLDTAIRNEDDLVAADLRPLGRIPRK